MSRPLRIDFGGVRQQLIGVFIHGKICYYTTMAIETTSLSGLLVIRWEKIEDHRGFFKHTFQLDELARALGREPRLRQGNHSRSRAGVLRGFHTEQWDKLVYVVRGTALCVVADARPDSPTFSRTERFVMGDTPGEHLRLFVSEGLSNAFYCFSETDYLNDVSAEFNPAHRHGVAWNDPTLAVTWPTEQPVLSEKDSSLPTLRDLHPNHPIFG